MKPNYVSRRQVFTVAMGAGLGNLLPGAGHQQQVAVPAFSINPQQFGTLHRGNLTEIQKMLNGIPVDSKDGLKKLVRRLVDLELITAAVGELLERLIDTLFEPKFVPETALEKVRGLYREAVDKADQIAIAVVGIAQDSLAYVKERGTEIDVKRAVFIVASDLSGALTGAATLSKFGPPIIAAIGALAGAVASSGTAAFATTPAAPPPASKK